MEDFEPMSCNGLHHICDCRRTLEEELVTALDNVVRGIERMRTKMQESKRGQLKTQYHIDLDYAISILRRANKLS